VEIVKAVMKCLAMVMEHNCNIKCWSTRKNDKMFQMYFIVFL